MRVVLASNAGFCFGVQRAVDEAVKCARTRVGRVYTYGPLIHNEAVIRDLLSEGIVTMPAGDAEGKVPRGSTIIIRAHGVGKDVYERLSGQYENVVDATCPFVKKIHRIVRKHSVEGDTIVITGTADHPEVVGIRGWIEGPSYVVSNEEEAKKLPDGLSGRICLVSQTTFHYNKFQDVVEIIKEKGYNVTAYNTICNATEERQTEAARIAKDVDAMLVLGGENSSNSKKLYEICRNLCPNTFFLQDSKDLDQYTLQSFDSIGITAGASTPQYIIEEVQKICQK